MSTLVFTKDKQKNIQYFRTLSVFGKFPLIMWQIMPTILVFIPSDFQTFSRPLDVPSNLRRGHFVSTAAAAHKKTRPLTVEP